MQTPQEVFQAMNPTKILIAILENQGITNVPLDIFLNSGTDQKALNVEYNEDEKKFIFELREPIEQSNDQENVESNSNE